MNNTTAIPPPTCFQEKDIMRDIENCTIYFFDLATTGLSNDCKIAHVSGFDYVFRLFGRYVYPNGHISFGATKVTGITKVIRKVVLPWES